MSVGVVELLLPCLLLVLQVVPSAVSQNNSSNCPTKCIDIEIPYPFGIGRGCARDESLRISCNTSKAPFWRGMEISKIQPVAQGEVVVFLDSYRTCYNKSTNKVNPIGTPTDLSGSPFSFSGRNKFMVTGCATTGYMFDSTGHILTNACTSICQELSTVANHTCSHGIGCCENFIMDRLQYFNVELDTFYSRTNVADFNPCSHAFLVEDGMFDFSQSIISADQDFTMKLPVVIDWAIETPEVLSPRCETAMKNLTSYACVSNNSICINSPNNLGYLCNCSKGYSGNPYIKDGCQDIKECEDPSTNTCSDICTNTIGSYTCSCPDGYYGDGKKIGKGCIRENVRFPLLQVVLGVGLGSMFLLVGGCWMYWFMKKKRMLALKEKYFKQNGGFVLNQRMSSNSTIAQVIKIFQTEELKKATDNYSEAMVLGGGGQGTVYRGILLDNRVVAIKKSILVSKDQVEDFINEVIILSQTIHRNVVRLLGCCLESEIPMLVYEFIPNGSLHDHIHGDDGHRPTLPWDLRLRIAAETAGAIDYLHTAAAIPIYHRDIKSANILLDRDFAAKISDFGVSRLVAMDEVQVTTLVRGTLGYLDPVYFQTGKLTDKSDVYSFGVVLVELLTGQETISTNRGEAGRNLAQYFLTATKENRFFEIIDPRISGSRDQELLAVAEVAKACLSLKTEDRPTMKEVAVDLAKLRSTRHRENNHNRSKVVEDNEDENELKEMNDIMRRLQPEPGASEVFTGTLDDSISLLHSG